jgi:signal transduction histidine kinase/CheY-like chemotaxis protein
MKKIEDVLETYQCPKPNCPLREVVNEKIETIRQTEERLRLAGEREMKLEKQLRLAQKLESIGTLAGGIAHDFNNILGIILGFTELALEEISAEDLENSLGQIKRAGLRAKDLVSQILTFSRQAEGDRKPVFLAMLVKEVLKFLRASLPATVEVRYKIESKAAILADVTQIHQILMNLCTNAAYAMQEKGNGTLEVTLAEIEADVDFIGQYPGMLPGSYLKLTVTDTGQGMSPEVIERIYDPYFTTKPLGEGTGLGLAVVHGIVKSHGGIITVYSQIAKGTTFNVFLPRIEDVPVKMEEKMFLFRGNERILFVDDEEALANIGASMLRRLGYQVEVKTISSEALNAFRDNADKFDLVVTDYAMPNLSGVDLAKEILKIRDDILIILCSGFGETNIPGLKAMGFKKVISKPLTLQMLSEAVREVLDSGS